MSKFFKKGLDILIATISTMVLVGMTVFMLCGLFFSFSLVSVVITTFVVMGVIGLAIE